MRVKDEHMTHLVLTSGDKLPSLGLSLTDLTADTIYEAIRSGYRLLYSDYDHGNRIEAAKGIRRALDEGVCAREDLFIVA